LLTEIRCCFQPLSERSKDYILSLDIDADIGILRDKLSLCETAIDYFRTSSKLLQEGVKAGLTLYEITIMCCRNDNLGEIPSKLEILSNMAVELATTAVGNGRWHHAAASKAIAEQLSPVYDCSVLLSSESKLSIGSGFIKSVSSANFSSFPGSLASELAEAECNFKGVPEMAQSSASDESSDVGDAVTEQDEREEWAASVIADASMDRSISVMHFQQQRRRSRSHSVAEDESILSSSPKGFWCVPPGSTSLDDSSFDSGCLSWSPRNSPRTVPRHVLDVSTEDHHRIPDLSHLLVTSGPESLKALSVTFAESFVFGDLLPPPGTVNVTTGSSCKDMGITPKVRRSSGGGISRSKSYSAFTEGDRHSSLLSDHRMRVLQENDGWKSYFVKFVDLVIIRETASVALARDSS
jgi:hypothetical protein